MDDLAPDALTGQSSGSHMPAKSREDDMVSDFNRPFDAVSDGVNDAFDVVDDPEYKGYRLRWAQKRKLNQAEMHADDELPSPSLGLSVDMIQQCAGEEDLVQESNPPACTAADNSASVTHSFLTGVKLSNIVLPWEQPWLAPIFGDPFPAPSLAMPANWDPTFFDPSHDVMPGIEPVVGPIPTFSISRCVKHRVDRSFLEERASQTDRAVAKIRCFLEINADASETGRQLAVELSEDGQRTLLLSLIGTRSPGTIIKRMNALLHFFRWFSVNFDGDCLPFQEAHVWTYVRYLQDSSAAPTKAMSFIQSLRFAHYVLGVQGAEQCVQSRRLQGSAELQLALKKPTRQARPLTVDEVRRLHKATLDNSLDLQERVLAIHLLLMLYTRSRVSDLAHVEEVSHDVSRTSSTDGVPGFVQITTRYHKAARSAEKKSLLLPIVASSTSVVEDDWLVTWLRLRKKAGLKVAGEFNAAIQPAPNVNKANEWLVRPLSCSEVTLVLRGLLGCSDPDLTSHSLKATCLSWAAKAELPRDQRRLLGRHASAIQDSDSVYARDLAFAPAQALQRVIILIRDGHFTPDQNRAGYFKDGNPLVPGTPAPHFQPGTPAFLNREILAEPVPAVQADGGWEQVEVKSDYPDLRQSKELEEDEPELVPSSDSISSSSNCEDAESDDEKGNEVSDSEKPPSVQSFLHDAFVKNSKTGIIHRIPDIGLEVSGSVYANGELVQGKTTKCGRLASSGYSIVEAIPDWTAKCRICFKGCRAP